MTDLPESEDQRQRLERFRERQQGGPVRITREPVGGPIPEGQPAEDEGKPADDQ